MTSMEHQQHFARLGKRELGPHAYETQMPNKLASFLAKEEDSNSLPRVIPKLTHLLMQDPDVERAYLCTEAAVQVWKLPNEGAHFCGYRNIQMMLLALGHQNHPSERIPSRKLSIPGLQSLIETAWHAGINSYGQVQTGGIKRTRKHIGTSEAEALLLHLNIECRGRTFHGSNAHNRMLDAVETYFIATENKPEDAKVVQTVLPPVFLQRPQHSVTIIGFERMTCGSRRLLVFDPAWRPPSKLTRPVAELDCTGWSIYWILKRYRKSERYCKRFNAFETLEVHLPVTGAAGALLSSVHIDSRSA